MHRGGNEDVKDDNKNVVVTVHYFNIKVIFIYVILNTFNLEKFIWKQHKYFIDKTIKYFHSFFFPFLDINSERKFNTILQNYRSKGNFCIM